MGLFKFIKNAGANLFKKKEAADQTEEQTEEVKTANARELVNLISGLGLAIDDLEVRVAGDRVSVSGTTDSMEIREKIILAVGNVEGVAEVEALIEVRDPAPEAQFHTVVSGDSLSKIAKEYYGNAMKYPVIFEANTPMLTDPNKIYPGQVLRIPAL